MLGLSQAFEKTQEILFPATEYDTNVCVQPKQLCLCPRGVDSAPACCSAEWDIFVGTLLPETKCLNSYTRIFGHLKW